MSYMAVIDRFSWLPALKKHVIKAWPGTGLPSLVVQVAEWHHHSASCHLLVFPRFQLYTYGHRTFTVSGPTTHGTCYVTVCMSRTCRLLWRSPIVVRRSFPQSQAKECLWFSWFSILFHCFMMCLCCPLALHDIFHTAMAQYSLFVLKVP